MPCCVTPQQETRHASECCWIVREGELGRADTVSEVRGAAREFLACRLRQRASGWRTRGTADRWADGSDFGVASGLERDARTWGTAAWTGCSHETAGRQRRRWRPSWTGYWPAERRLRRGRFSAAAWTPGGSAQTVKPGQGGTWWHWMW